VGETRYDTSSVIELVVGIPILQTPMDKRAKVLKLTFMMCVFSG